MFFNSVKEINRLLSKGTVSIYLNVTIKKIFEFLSLKHLSPGQFWGAPTYLDITEF